MLATVAEIASRPMAGITIEGDVLRGEPPRFDAAAAADLAERLFGRGGVASPLGSERDQGFMLTGGDGPACVLKISNASEDPAIVDMETAAALHVLAADPTIPVAAPLPVLGSDPSAGPPAFRALVEGPGGASHLVRACAAMPGTASVEAITIDPDALFEHGVMAARVARALRTFFHPSAGRVLLWDVQHAADLRPMTDAIEDPAHRRLVHGVLDRFERDVAPRWSGLRSQVIHGDLTLDNALVDERGRITGIVDFGDMSHTAIVCDLSSALQSLLEGRTGEDVIASTMRVVDGYRSVTQLEDADLAVLPDLMSARLVTVAVLFGWRAARHPDNEYLRGWERYLWPLLAFLEEEGRHRIAERLRASTRSSAPSTLIERRAKAFGPALSPLTYDRPLHLVRGEGVWLLDADGNRYLDCYNNVPVVGHAHPRVTDAIARQSRLLNTNMRYLHETAIELAERLVSTMPSGSGLDTVMLVNSGSEANDTAWRLATAWTGARGGLVTSYAYHGVTEAIAALSPEEWLDATRPAHVDVFDPLDVFRDDSVPGDAAARLTEAATRLEGTGVRLAAAFVDGGFTSDGILAPDAAYVRALAERTHAVGALYVADEVQAGHGRSGSHLWSFAAMGVAADIVTLGKPMGNGHPVAAVVTRREIAERFATSTEWFSTFGGNPVAASAALAVLDVLEDEDLVAHAGLVGPALRTAIGSLAEAHPQVGDVRGIGLLTGVELVTAGSTEPDPRLAARVANGMRERGVLVGTTGRRGNVLKIRPPLVFGDEHIGTLVEALDGALRGA
jgi:4-aminobutyrate aminotransferase-like enzyme/Ser/Thr protein kinase RdoA (MazF antagonist)